MDQTMKMFQKLTETPGVPGRESAIRDVLRTYVQPYADEIDFDGLGSLIAVKKGAAADSPRIVLAAHLDEVGFMVTQITEDGFIKFKTLGGWWAQVMLAQRVHVQTKNGMIEGVIGSVPPHLLSLEARRKVVDIDDMFIDVGATSRKEAEEFGIRSGDAIVPVSPFTVMKNPKLMMAKAWDNRLGCAVVIEVMKRLKESGEQLPNTFYGVATVMEEVGRRGGRTVGQYLQPDLAFSIDVGIAADTPGISKVQMPTKMGAGPEICLYDAALIAHPELRDLVISIAEEEKIPYQLTTITGGATDAGSLHLVGSGVPALSLSVPARYIHSHTSIIHYDDFENLVKLVLAMLRRFDRTTVDKLRTY